MRAATRANPKTFGSTDSSVSLGSPAAGPAATSHRVLIQAAKKPSVPAIRDRRSDSTRSCDTIRDRRAPSATRTEISFWRDAARARSRLATLAHAMSSTRPTAPMKMSSDSRVSRGTIQS